MTYARDHRGAFGFIDQHRILPDIAVKPVLGLQDRLFDSRGDAFGSRLRAAPIFGRMQTRRCHRQCFPRFAQSEH
jgi:hypothetical protein